MNRALVDGDIRLLSYFRTCMCMPKSSLMYPILFEKVKTCVEFVQVQEQ